MVENESGCRSIPSQLRKNGFTLNLIKRIGGYCIYEVLDSNVSMGYEVHKVRVAKERIIKSANGGIVSIPAHEYLASNEEFGAYAWRYQTLESTMKKYNELVML